MFCCLVTMKNTRLSLAFSANEHFSALDRTAQRRPDLLEKLTLSEEQQQLMAELNLDQD